MKLREDLHKAETQIHLKVLKVLHYRIFDEKVVPI